MELFFYLESNFFIVLGKQRNHNSHITKSKEFRMLLLKYIILNKTYIYMNKHIIYKSLYKYHLLLLFINTIGIQQYLNGNFQSWEGWALNCRTCCIWFCIRSWATIAYSVSFYLLCQWVLGVTPHLQSLKTSLSCMSRIITVLISSYAYIIKCGFPQFWTYNIRKFLMASWLKGTF